MRVTGRIPGENVRNSDDAQDANGTLEQGRVLPEWVLEDASTSFTGVYDHDGDPFPHDPGAPEETRQLTFRAVAVGSILGFVVGASNLYLGLKTGWWFTSKPNQY